MSESGTAPNRRRVHRPPPPTGAEQEPGAAHPEPTVVSRVEVSRALDALIPEEPTGRSEANPSPHEREGGEPESFPWEGTGKWGKVVSDLYSINVEATYVKLKSALSLGEGATEYGVVLRAADKAEQYAFEAGQLARLAKLEQENVDLECDKELEVLRTQAREELEDERSKQPEEKPEPAASTEEPVTEQEGAPPATARKGRKKAEPKPARRAPTIQDLEDKMMANWPKRVKSLKMRKQEAHAVRGTMDRLADAWESRCATLRMMGEKVAPHR